jgi:predicted ATPase/signal transduction histidine kinase
LDVGDGTERDEAPRQAIYRGRRFVVYRVGPPGASEVLKTASPEAAPKAWSALAHEEAILRRLDVEGVVKIRPRRWADSSTLVLEDAGHETLKERLRRPLPLEAFFAIAVPLGQSLARVHQRNVVHRDLNPANVVLDAQGRPTIIDFDLATVAEGLALADATQLLGTLPYIAPEQTGRMNRLTDRRSDLYALGATFYEMLTGSPPFLFTDPLELVHAHLARVPVSPSVINAQVPPLLSQIVLKLMAKMPEERYQSAEALAFDLTEAQQRWERARAIEPFELGRLDLARQLSFPPRIYGRDRELGELRAALERVSAGRSELVLIAGEAGTGKTALVGELRRLVNERGGRLVSGKFEALAADVPHAPLIEALRELLRGLSEEAEEAQATWRARIREAVEPSGAALTDSFPDLARWIGSDPATPSDPLMAQQRLHLALQALLQLFAAEGRPLVLFLDDLQWTDFASLEALRALAQAADSRHLLLIGSFRADEVAAEHPLRRMLEQLQRAGVPITRLTLGPLDPDAVEELLADTLRQDRPAVRPLARLLVSKTAGNPFFLRQLVRSLQRDGLLTFDLGPGVWRWDLPRIEEVGVTENVIALLIATMASLPDETRALLPVAAAVGSVVPLGTLALIAARDEDAIAAALASAVTAGLICAEVSARREEGVAYRFAHDRVQQAALSLLSDPERRALHLRIGRCLRRLDEEERGEERLFSTVHQLNVAGELLTDAAERLDLARLSQRAGAKAAGATAWGPALTYLRIALDLLPAGAWQELHPLVLRLHRDAAECAYLTGDFALSDRLIEVALAAGLDPLEQASLAEVSMSSATLRGARELAIERGRTALRLLGQPLPEGELAEAAAAERRSAEALLSGRAPGELLSAPAMTGPVNLAVMRILVRMLLPAWFSDPAQYELVAARSLRLTLERGNDRTSVVTFAHHGAILAALGQYGAADAFAELSIALAQKLGARALQTTALYQRATFVLPWRQPLAALPPVFRATFELASRAGDLQTAAFCRSTIVGIMFAAGADLDTVVQEVHAAIPYLARLRAPGQELLIAHLQETKCLRGLTRGRDSFDDDGFAETSFLQSLRSTLAQSYYHLCRLRTAYLFRQFSLARAEAETAERALRCLGSVHLQQVEHNVWQSLTLAALCEGAPEAAVTGAKAQLAANQRRLERWAQACPENFRHKWLLVEAELARIEGRASEASQLFEQAIEGAGAQGNVLDEALAHELTGRHAMGLGRRRIALLHLRAAGERFARWGAAEKSRALLEEFPEAGLAQPPATSTLPALDLHSVLRAAESISTEVTFDRLLSRLLAICIEAAGADRVVLVLEEEGQPTVRATLTAGESISQQRTPVGQSEEVPGTAIEAVRGRRRPLVVDDAVHDTRVAHDPYVRARAPRSMLVLPAQRQGTLVATLYLENRLTTNAFSTARVGILDLLSTQIAIAIENSLLFEKSQHAIHLRDEFLSVASHELNTPMAALILNLEELAAGCTAEHPDPASFARMATSAERQARRLWRLISELLDVTRIEAGAFSFRREPVELGALIRATVARSDWELRRAGCSVTLELGPPLTGQWDPSRVDQVLWNLLHNAAKFGAGKPIVIGARRVGDRAQLSVSDQGIGIEPERQPHVFDRFGRGVSAVKYGGLGLGLFISRQIVEALGGSIRVTSQPGQGATFTVDLPLEP